MHAHRRKRTEAMRAHIILALLVIILILFSRGIWNIYGAYRESVDRRALVEDRYSTLDARVHEMDRTVALLKTDEGKEAEIRRSFNVVKRGEQVAIIVDTEDVSHASPKKQSWTSKLWRGFWFGARMQ